MEKLIIYGLGKAYKQWKDILGKEYDIVALCDKQKIEGAIIPSEIQCVNDYDKIFITSTKYCSEIYEELISVYNINPKKIISESILLEDLGIAKNRRILFEKNKNNSKYVFQNKAQLFFRWILLAENGITIDKMLKKRNYKKIALYGYNDISICLLYALRDKLPTISFIIDNNAENISISYKVVLPDCALINDVDAIIMCCENFENEFDFINKAKCEVITFGELIYDV